MAADSSRPFTPERLAERRRTSKRPQTAKIVAPAAYSPKAFGEAYGIGQTTLYEEIKAGRLVARKIGTRTIILASDAETWARSLSRAGRWGG